MTNKARGTISECWRYPVKSFQGLRQDGLTITGAGVEGDRTYGLLDVEPGRLLSAKRSGALFFASATDRDVTLPDGTLYAVDDPALDAALSEWIGRPIRFARADQTDQISYQMTFDPPDDDAELFDIPAPAGSFVDLAPVHLVSSSTLRGCAEARPDLDWDVRRFRPNLLVDLDSAPFAEDTWIGREIRVGDVVLHIDGPTVRCAMPLRAQPDGLERQAGLFQAINEVNPTFPGHLGLYCSVITAGTVSTGDPVTVDLG